MNMVLKTQDWRKLHRKLHGLFSTNLWVINRDWQTCGEEKYIMGFEGESIDTATKACT
jgi:hypothetical protein